MSPKKEYPRPFVTVDCAIFAYLDNALKVLLINRKDKPFDGQWALPGGYVEENEDLEEAAIRELEEETEICRLSGLEQLKAFGAPNRDPRGWTVSVAYLGWLRPIDHAAEPGSDAGETEWRAVNDLPELAFDHEAIIEAGIERLAEKAMRGATAFEMLNREFTIDQAVGVLKELLDERISERKLRAKLVESGILFRQKKRLSKEDKSKDKTKKKKKENPTYRFDREKFRRISKRGFGFGH